MKPRTAVRIRKGDGYGKGIRSKKRQEKLFKRIMKKGRTGINKKRIYKMENEMKKTEGKWGKKH